MTLTYFRETSTYLMRQTGNVSRVNTSMVFLNRTSCSEIALSTPREIDIGIFPFYYTYLSNSKFWECWRLLEMQVGWGPSTKENTIRNRNLIIYAIVYVTRLTWSVVHRGRSSHIIERVSKLKKQIIYLLKPLGNEDMVPVDIKTKIN